MAYLSYQGLPNVQNKYFVWLVDLHTIYGTYKQKTWFHTKNDIRICLVDMRHVWSIKRFLRRVKQEMTKMVFLFHISYLITLMAYLCSKWTPNVQIEYFMFVRSAEYVLNTGWKRDSYPNDDTRKGLLDMKYSWTKNACWDVNNKKLRLFHISYLLTIMISMRS
jgi:hypothetical protein